MAYLYARTKAGELVQFERDQLAVFWPRGDGSRSYFEDRVRFVESLWAVVSASGRWYTGPFEVYDGLHDIHPMHWGRSSPYPRAVPKSRPFRSRHRLIPELACRLPRPRFFFNPTQQFEEISPADAVKWLYSHVGRVPKEAQAILDAAVTPCADAQGGQGPDLATIDFAELAEKLRRKHPRARLMPLLVEFMEGKTIAPIQAVAEYVHDDEQATAAAVRENANRTSAALRALGSNVSFKAAGEYVRLVVDAMEHDD